MNIDFSQIHWLSVLVCFVIGQVLSTVWFAAIFGDKWANAYAPGKTKQEHTKEIPGYTYAIGAVCMFLVSLALEITQNYLGINDAIGGISLGLFVAVFFVAATMIPGYVFLKKYSALGIALGSQVLIVTVLSTVLSVW